MPILKKIPGSHPGISGLRKRWLWAEKKGIEVKTIVTFGHAAEEIVHAARDMKAHLIAMSAHSRPGFVRWAIGSVTDKVMRLEGTIPVMAVKPADKDQTTVVQPMESLRSMMKHS
jgi:hypothetical protein